MAYKVTAALAIASVGGEWDRPYKEGGTLTGGRPVYVYKGGVLPAGTANVEHLVAMGLVESTSERGAAAAAREAGIALGAVEQPGPAPSERTPVRAHEEGDAEARAKLPADGSAPALSAGKPVWVEYAVAQGMDRQAASEASKDDLIKALRS